MTCDGKPSRPIPSKSPAFHNRITTGVEENYQHDFRIQPKAFNASGPDSAAPSQCSPFQLLPILCKTHCLLSMDCLFLYQRRYLDGKPGHLHSSRRLCQDSKARGCGESSQGQSREAKRQLAMDNGAAAVLNHTKTTSRQITQADPEVPCFCARARKSMACELSSICKRRSLRATVLSFNFRSRIAISSSLVTFRVRSALIVSRPSLDWCSC